MSRFNSEKLRVTFMEPSGHTGPLLPRKYTLTHSDRTGELFLTIGKEFDADQISGIYTRLMRDEVLGEWRSEEGGVSLHMMVHVSGGLVVGTAGQRYSILKREMPLVLTAIRYGDRSFFNENPEFDRSPIFVHFKSKNQAYDCVEEYGSPRDYSHDLSQ